MKWVDFLHQILDERQVKVLQFALKTKAPVHFYGVGLGKSTIVEVLNAAGYKATAPEDVSGGAAGPCGVPLNIRAVCFHVKKKRIDSVIPNLVDTLKAREREIITWVNTSV